MRRINPVKIDTPEYYEQVWGMAYNHKPWYDGGRQRQLARRLKPGQSLIDLGAGCFGTAQYIAEHLHTPGVKLYMVDYSHTAIQVVTEMLKGKSDFTYLNADVCHVPLPDASFDVVVAGEVIEHCEVPQDLVKEMARLCRPGGWMSLSTVDTDCANARKLHADGVYPEHIWAFDLAELREMFTPYGAAEAFLFGDYQCVECQRRA